MLIIVYLPYCQLFVENLVSFQFSSEVVMLCVQVNPDDSELTRVTEVFRKHWETLEGESPHTHASPGQRLPLMSCDLSSDAVLS